MNTRRCFFTVLGILCLLACVAPIAAAPSGGTYGASAGIDKYLLDDVDYVINVNASDNSWTAKFVFVAGNAWDSASPRVVTTSGASNGVEIVVDSAPQPAIDASSATASTLACPADRVP